MQTSTPLTTYSTTTALAASPKHFDRHVRVSVFFGAVAKAAAPFFNFFVTFVASLDIFRNLSYNSHKLLLVN